MNKISSKTLLKVYLYLILLITLTVMLFSGAYLVKTSISYITPLPFSYTLYKANTEKDMKEFEIEKCSPEENVFIFNNKEYCWDDTKRETDLINSTTIFVSMLVLFLLHIWGLNQTKKIATPKWLLKGYTFISLMIYSITGIVAIPTSIYLTTNYLLMKTAEYSTPTAPLYSIALVVFTIPLWFVFFKRTSNLKD